MLKIGNIYTRREISRDLGGGIQDYLPHKDNRVTCVCVKKEKNPQAPNVILVGIKPAVRRWGAVLCSQNETVPLFIKQDSNEWKYIGDYTVDRWTSEPDEIQKHEKLAKREITRVLYLKKDPQASKSGVEDKKTKDKTRKQQLDNGAGFGDPEVNLEVEHASIAYVKKWYKTRGWSVDSVEKENRGFDLICSKENIEEHVEVKGIQGKKLSFIITRNEVQQAKSDPKFVICMVTSVLSKRPKLYRLQGNKFINKFKLEPLSYKANIDNGKKKLIDFLPDPLRHRVSKIIKSMRTK